jgi:hypothetical protein
MINAGIVIRRVRVQKRIISAASAASIAVPGATPRFIKTTRPGSCGSKGRGSGEYILSFNDITGIGI